MKFQLAINLERMDDSLDMKDVARHTLEMVQMADSSWSANSTRAARATMVLARSSMGQV